MLKRASIHFSAASEFDRPGLKFGGEPFGLPKSLWPSSKQTSEPMQFICQIPLLPELFPCVKEGIAYLFMTPSGAEAETWKPDGNENALIIVPKERLTTSRTVGDAPRLFRMVKKWWRSRLVEETCVYSANLTFTEDPDFIPAGRLQTLSEEEASVYRKTIGGNKLGGAPFFLQDDELPVPEPWHLLIQLDATTLPFWINFGDSGIGYAFINGSGTEGRFLWQCL